MARICVTLDEKDLADAIGLWVKAKFSGIRLKNQPKVEHTPATNREKADTSVIVEVEPDTPHYTPPPRWQSPTSDAPV